MPRAKLDTGLQDVQGQIVKTGTLLETGLKTILTVLTDGEAEKLRDVLTSKSIIGTLCADVEHQALRLLILQQPLGGQDLRFLTSALYISDYLGRMNDALAEIAQTLQQTIILYQQTFDASSIYSTDGEAIDQTGAFTDVVVLRGLFSLGREVEYMMHTIMIAFIERDSTMAQTLKQGNMIELRYTPIGQDIMKMQASAASRDATFVQRITSLLWIAHKLAEIATYITAICTRVIFIVEG